MKMMVITMLKIMMKPVHKSSLSSFPSFSLLSKPSLSVVLLIIIMMTTVMMMTMMLIMMVATMMDMMMIMTLTMMTKIIMWGKCMM